MRRPHRRSSSNQASRIFVWCNLCGCIQRRQQVESKCFDSGARQARGIGLCGDVSFLPGHRTQTHMRWRACAFRTDGRTDAGKQQHRRPTVATRRRVRLNAAMHRSASHAPDARISPRAHVLVRWVRVLWGLIITGSKVHNGSSLPVALGMAGDGWG